MGRENLIPGGSFKEDIDSIPLEGRMVGRKKMLHELDAKVEANEGDEPIEEKEEKSRARNRKISRRMPEQRI